MWDSGCSVRDPSWATVIILYVFFRITLHYSIHVVILRRVFYFFGDVIEIIPTVVRPQSRVECRGHVANTRRRVAEIIVKVFGVPLENLVHAAGDNNENRDEFRCRESILHSSGQVDAVAVYVRDDHCAR